MVPGYRVHEGIGTGASAVVYRAHDARDREVALKVFPPAQRRRWLQEVAAATDLSHEHIVSALDVLHLPDGTCAIAYPLMEGSAADLLDRHGPFDAHEVRVVLRDVLAALDHLHGRGLLHGDVKPSNVLRDARGRYHLCDLGTVGRPAELTVGEGGGTPVYFAPERLYDEATPASDLYSLGIVAFELLVGYAPFEGSPRELLRQHLRTAPAFSALADSTLRPLIEQLLEKEPRRRPADARAALDILRRVEDGTPAAVPRLPPVAPLRPEARRLPPAEPTTLRRLHHLKVPARVQQALPFAHGAQPLVLLDLGSHFEVRTPGGLQRQSLLPHAGTWSVPGADRLAYVTGGTLWWLDVASGRRVAVVDGCGSTEAVDVADEGRRWIRADRRSLHHQGPGGSCALRTRHEAFRPRVALLPDGFAAATGRFHDHVTLFGADGDERAAHALGGPVLALAGHATGAVALTLPVDDAGWGLWHLDGDRAVERRLSDAVLAPALVGDLGVWIDGDLGLWAAWSPDTPARRLGALPGPVDAVAASADRRFLTTLTRHDRACEVTVWQLD